MASSCRNELSLPEEVISQRNLSTLESIVYALQQHEQVFPDGNRAGFLIGDGAGVGRVNYENYLKGRKRGRHQEFDEQHRYRG